MKYLILGLMIFCVACDGSNNTSNQEIMTAENPDPSLLEAGPVNPIATRTETFGVEGNLYKPRGDDHGASPGNLVVLLGAKFTEQFDSCEIQLRSGEVRQLTCINNVPWTHIPYSCFANGNRQHWRADFKCSEVAEVKVTCREFQQEVVFTVPEAQRGNVCSRFG